MGKTCPRVVSPEGQGNYDIYPPIPLHEGLRAASRGINSPALLAFFKNGRAIPLQPEKALK